MYFPRLDFRKFDMDTLKHSKSVLNGFYLHDVVICRFYGVILPSILLLLLLNIFLHSNLSHR